MSDEGREREPMGRSRRLPPGRAMVGGALVALAAAGVLVAHRSASTPPESRYLVLTSDVAAGSVLDEQHLGTLALDLPGDLSAVKDSDLDDVVGRTVRSPLQQMDLLRDGDLFDRGHMSSPDQVEVSVDLPAARAMEGAIGTGSVVDLLATDPGGSGTRAVARSVSVLGISGDEHSGIGARDSTRLRLVLRSAEEAAAVVDASIRSELSVVLPSVRSSEPGT